MGFENGEALLRLHSREPIQGTVHGSDEQIVDQNQAAQGGGCTRLHQAIPNSSPGIFRDLSRRKAGNLAGETNQAMDSGEEGRFNRKAKSDLGRFGGGSIRALPGESRSLACQNRRRGMTFGAGTRLVRAIGLDKLGIVLN